MNPIVSQRISSLLCSVRRSMQKHWAYQSSRHWLLWLLRATLLVLTLSFSFISPRSSSQVSALSELQETPYPTATFAPLFPTSTAGVGGVDCPAGTPVGYGTLTPNPAWLALCSRCLPTGTPQPTGTSVFPTSTIDPLVTPGTGTPTITVTPTATGTPSSCGVLGQIISVVPYPHPIGQNTLVCENISNGSIWCHGMIEYIDNHPSGDYGRVPIAISVPQIAPNTNVVIQSRSVAAGGYYLNSTYYATAFGVAMAGAPSQPCSPNNGINTRMDDGIYNCSTGYTGTNTLYVYAFCGGAVGSSCRSYMDYTFSFSADNSCLSTPMPTVTPTVSLSYCGTLDTTSDSSSFQLPTITGGTPVCGGAGGFIIPFSWFQIIGIELDDLIVPYVEVCFVPTSFGVLVIADNVIDLDVVAYILGALFLLSLVV